MVLLIKGYYGLIQLFGDLCHLILRIAEKRQTKALTDLSKKLIQGGAKEEQEWQDAISRAVFGTDILVNKSIMDKFILFVDNFVFYNMFKVVRNVGQISQAEYASMNYSYSYIAKLYFILAYKFSNKDQSDKIESYRNILGDSFIDRTEPEVDPEFAESLKEFN